MRERSNPNSKDNRMAKKSLSPKKHRDQIEAYSRERKFFIAYANALEKVLKKSCQLSIPEAVVQARAKTVSSFAEKCVRKADKYEDPIHDMTDLCGARVIVQTLEQVKAVRMF